MEDRRRFPRWTISNKVFYKHPENPEEGECLSKDISCSGLCLSSGQALQKDTKLYLKIYLGNNFLPIAANARVVWSIPATEVQDNPFVSGVIFESLRDIDKDAIFNYAYQFRKEEILKHWWQGVS